MQKTETSCPQRPNRRLRLARERRGWTQEGLAERVGASALSVGRWERGSVTPGPYYRRKLCELYQLSAEELGFLAPLPAVRTAPAAALLAPNGASVLLDSSSGAPKRQFPGVAALALSPAVAPHAPPVHLTVAPLASGGATSLGVGAGQTDAPALAAPTQPWAPFTHGAPTPLTQPSEAALIGREVDLRRLDDLFAGERRTPLVALYGLPGVGKTALATALAHRHPARAAFPDGALWAGLGQTPDTLSLLSGWGAALGMTAADLARHTTVESLGRALRAAIGHRRLLLVIDDAWSLADALALRVGGPNCAHLVTTRFPTIAWQFAPMGTLAVSELSAADGVALLAALAPAAVAAEPVEAHELARSVGGLPLALTLMGSYLHAQAQSGQPRRLRAAIALLRQMEQRMELARPYAPVDAPPGLAPGATQSLQATLALSEAALSAGARDMLRALACLPAKPSSFDEDAALAIANASAAELDELSDAGLLESVGPGRYTLHQTVHDYACYARPVPSGAERRLVEFYVAHTGNHTNRYAQLEPDSENIVVALQLAEEQALTPLVARGGVAFAPFLEARGLYTQAAAYLGVAQTAAVALGDAPAQAGAALGLARIASRQGRMAEAERLYAQGLALAEVVGEPRLTCTMLIGAGEAAMGSGDFARAEAHLREALTLARAANDHRRMGETFRLLGEIADAAGHFPQGDMLYYEGLALARQAEDVETVCMLLQNLGGKAVVRGDYATGEALLREGLALARANSYRQRVSALLNNLGASAQRQGRPDEADRLFGESLALARAIGQPSRMIQALENLAWGAAGRNAFDLAATYADECLTLAREIDHPLLIGDCLCLCGSLRLKQTHGAWYAEVASQHRLASLLAQAAAFFAAAQRIGETVSAHNVLVRATYGLARIAAAQGRVDDAQRHAACCRAYITAENRAYAGEMTDWLATLEATAHAPTAAPLRPTEAVGLARVAQPAFRTPTHPSSSPMV